jgi:hypothetical protein
VADGAVIWLARLSVTSRATRFAYGVQIIVPFDANNQSHRGRPIVAGADGVDHVIGFWCEVVPRVSTDLIIWDYIQYLTGSRDRTESLTQPMLYAISSTGRSKVRHLPWAAANAIFMSTAWRVRRLHLQTRTVSSRKLPVNLT